MDGEHADTTSRRVPLCAKGMKVRTFSRGLSEIWTRSAPKSGRQSDIERDKESRCLNGGRSAQERDLAGVIGIVLRETGEMHVSAGMPRSQRFFESLLSKSEYRLSHLPI